MSPRDVETEIYERLYGASHHGPRGERAPGERILIGNGDPPVAPGADGLDPPAAPLRRAPRGRGGASEARHLVKAVANGIRSEAATALSGAAGRGRDAVRRVRPTVAEPRGRTRNEVREPARGGAQPIPSAPGGRAMALALLAAGLIGVSLVVAFNSSGGTDRQARKSLGSTTPTEVPKLSPGPTSPPRRSTPRAGAATRAASAPAAVERARTTTKPRRRSRSHRTAQRKPKRRSTGSLTPKRRPAPTQKETSPTSPAPPASGPPPTVSTPPTTGAGGAETGGASAPPEPTG